MTGFLLDTTARAWTIYATDRLSPEARTAVTRADVIMVSPVSLFEIGQKVCAGKWPEVEPILDRLPEVL